MSNKMYRTILTISIIALATVFSGSVIAGPNSSAGCSVDMSIPLPGLTQSVVAYSNDTIDVAIVADNVSNLDTYQIELQFDPKYLQFAGAYEEDPFILGIDNILKKNGGKTIGFQTIENKAGLLNITNTLVGASTDQAPEGTGVLAIVSFKVLEKGTSAISIKSAIFVDSNHNEDKVERISNGQLN
jgi:hypothetical protein